MNPGFVHLRLHTEYSLADSVIRVPELMQAARTIDMPAVALTDQSNLFALIKFYQEAEEAGIKPLVGADLRVRDGDNGETALITLLCCDHKGYLNLSALITRSYLEGQKRGQPLVEREWFTGRSAGLIALSGGREGDVGRALLAGRAADARARLAVWQTLFPQRFYIELQRTNRDQEAEYLDAAVKLAAAEGVPVVATNDVRFITADEFEAHEARVCIQEGRVLADPRRPKLYSEQQYLKSGKEMAELFADLPEALENSVEIAKRCNLTLELGKNYLPAFPVPEGYTTDSFLRAEAERGLVQRLEKILAKAGAQREVRERQYRERLHLELDVIAGMGFPGYFLIVADFIRWARENGVPVGPGRGSGAGSRTCSATTSTTAASPGIGACPTRKSIGIRPSRPTGPVTTSSDDGATLPVETLPKGLIDAPRVRPTAITLSPDSPGAASVETSCARSRAPTGARTVPGSARTTAAISKTAPAYAMRRQSMQS